MPLHDPPTDRQAETRGVEVVPGGVGLVELDKRALELVAGHADPGVPDRDDHDVLPACGIDGDGPRRVFCILDGVGDQVVEDLTEEDPVGPDGDPRWDVVVKDDGLRLERDRVVPKRVVKLGPQVEGFEVELDVEGVHPGELQGFLDQVFHVGDVVAGDLKEAPELRVLLALEEPRHERNQRG